MKVFHILSVIPDVFGEYFNSSILGRAQKKKIISVKSYDIRKWTTDKHHKVDDRPFGGGPGMVLKIEPIFGAIENIKRKIESKTRKKEKIRTILFSTRGKKFDSSVAKRLLKYDQLILICGRYEGVDERVIKYIADEEISMGDFVLSGGEIPAMALIDSVSRFIPGVLGKEESLEEINGSFPTYTRPEIFYPDRKNKKKKWPVPKILLSGNGKKIDEWRRTGQL